MNVLIVGAQLANKGAESMLYIATDEVKKRYPDAEVYFATIEEYEEDKYRFKKLYYSERAKIIALGGLSGWLEFGKALIWDAGKIVLGKHKHLRHYFDVKKAMPKIDMVIDVSGFSVGTKWSKAAHISYINNIRLAQKYNIPIYLMPQSFGPFDYSQEMQPIKEKLSVALKYPKVIYAREKNGYEELKKAFDLRNVRKSTDLVLQNRGIELDNVFKEAPEDKIPIVTEPKCVGIVPNIQCFNHGNKEKNMMIYNAVIKQLVDDGFKVIVFRHSREDLPICKEIKKNFIDCKAVALEEKEFSCLEYDEYVKQFTFVVGSRFHGLVHAYRNNIPCVALGWAIKYQELADCVGQSLYAFDITDTSCEIGDILKNLSEMENKHERERLIIKNKMKEMQKDNCFDCISERWFLNE